MDIITLTVGDLSTNCYLVTSDEETLIIDPGDEADFITQTILENKLRPKSIVLTHGHFDHVLGCLELKLNFNVPILLHKNDEKIYTSANQSALHWLKRKTLKVPPVNQFIKEGDKITFGKESLTILETPGHTHGSICLYSAFPSPVLGRGKSVPRHGEGQEIQTILFTGDTLFADGVGRTDFSYSKPLQLTKSLEKILSLPGDTNVYSGHEDSFVLKNHSLLVQSQ